MRAALLVTTVAVACIAAPAARAGTVSVHVPHCDELQSKYGACYPDEARFTAQPGEANRVTVTAAVDPATFQPRVTITDSGAPLSAGAGCTQVDAATATCTGYLLTARVELGDGDDEASGAGVLSGGAGNDTLRGSHVLRGGDGDDVIEGDEAPQLIQGGRGRDSLRGGGGGDNFVDDGAGEADSVDGGGGSDTVSYQDRRTPVTVSLDQPAAGEDGLASIENVRGGLAGDRLTGDALANTLDGGAGDDTIAGGGAGDVVAGDEGRDRLDGGPGDDLVSDGEDTAGNGLVCGAGHDRVDPGPNSLVGADCEEVAAGDLELVGRLELRLPLASPRSALAVIRGLRCLDLPCRLRMTLATRAGTPLGAARRAQRTRRQRLPRAVGLRLSRAGRRIVARASRLTVRLTVRFSDGGDPSRASFLVPVGRG